ncbi:MAG: decarboxylating 6-phosphogluconate dehydrogenase [bacterium]|nr:decarboxylating 6-phosphogluconate dehydrogenase [bacterium]
MEENISLALFGLGRMGGQIARRLHNHKYRIYAWNRSELPVIEFKKFGGFSSQEIGEVVGKLRGDSRIFWLMLPHRLVDEFIAGKDHLGPHLRTGDIVIDGGNSFYKDSIRRAAELGKRGIAFYDCGTSGGVFGEENGFSLMVGGPKEEWPRIEPLMKTLSQGDNYALLGKNGAGHFAKMVHNGIEYGMMEAIAEGYAVLEASGFDFDLLGVTTVYQKGSVIRSWLIDLCKNIFEYEDLETISGRIDSTGEGEWTVAVAEELGVDVRVIKDALLVRKESGDKINQQKFSNKIVALMRKQFGGHAVHHKGGEGLSD